MTYAAVLVHAEAVSRAAPRLKLAAQVADMFGAALIGVGAEVAYPVTVGALGEAALAADQSLVAADLQAAEAAFRTAAAGVAKGAQWRVQSDLPEAVVAANARAADLIVAGPRRAASLGFYGSCDPGELLMRSGRPILLAPEEMTALDASSVLVAWKDTRESRRAVSDALPFLQRASQVMLVGICEHDADEPEVKSQLKDVAAALARHGVKAATASRPRPSHGVARDLMHVAEIQEAGLVVAGGYGHSRMREWVFGGVTDSLLDGAGRAVLLSH